MADSNDSAGESARSIGAEMDRICDAFEAQWRMGLRPAIEPLLSHIDHDHRDQLFRELLHLELIYRRKRAEEPELEVYLKHYAEYGGVVEAVFAALDASPVAPSRGTVAPVDAGESHELGEDDVPATVNTDKGASSTPEESPPTINF